MYIRPSNEHRLGTRYHVTVFHRSLTRVTVYIHLVMIRSPDGGWARVLSVCVLLPVTGERGEGQTHRERTTSARRLTGRTVRRSGQDAGARRTRDRGEFRDVARSPPSSSTGRQPSRTYSSTWTTSRSKRGPSGCRPPSRRSPASNGSRRTSISRVTHAGSVTRAEADRSSRPSWAWSDRMRPAYVHVGRGRV